MKLYIVEVVNGSRVSAFHTGLWLLITQLDFSHPHNIIFVYMQV